MVNDKANQHNNQDLRTFYLTQTDTNPSKINNYTNVYLHNAIRFRARFNFHLATRLKTLMKRILNL